MAETGELSTKLWDLANIITGFSVAQSIGAALSLGKDLALLQRQSLNVKYLVLLITLIVDAAYCAAVKRCSSMGAAVDGKHLDIWNEAAYWRMACIVLFSGVFVFGLFAPNLMREKAPSGDSQG